MFRTPPQLQHRQIPTATHMGPAFTVFSSVQTKTILTSNYHSQPLPPTGTPPHLSSPSSPAVHLGGGFTFFLIIIHIGKYTCPLLIPPLFIYM